jgi:hypothetical protein
MFWNSHNGFTITFKFTLTLSESRITMLLNDAASAKVLDLLLENDSNRYE